MVNRRRTVTLLMRVWILTIILTAFCLSVPANGFAASPGFVDLSADDPVYPYINYLLQKDLIKGYPDGSIRADDSITRAEFTALLVRACGLEGVRADTPTFKDLAPDHWAYQAIEAAGRQGLVKGYPDGSFRPGAPVTRAETSALLLRLTNEPLPAVLPAKPIGDITPDNWAWPQVVASLDAGLLTMTGEGSFAPNNPATRGQVARGLAMMLNISPERAGIPLTGTLVPVKGEVFLTQSNQGRRLITGEILCGVGSTIATGCGGKAELTLPDGSGFRIEPNTTLTITKARGLSTILRDGSPGAMVDLLEVKLTAGKIFGALAPLRFLSDKGEGTGDYAQVILQPGATVNEAPFFLTPWKAALTSVSSDTVVTQKSLPWWKKSHVKRTRVKVDMPWGVACVRGCFWMNEVGLNRQTTSVVEGSVAVTAGGREVTVGPGYSTSIAAAGQSPQAPARMTADQKNEWLEVRAWVEERAAAIENSVSLITEESSSAPLSDTVEEIMSSFEEAVSGAEPEPQTQTSATSSDGGGGGGGSGDATSSPFIKG